MPHPTNSAKVLGLSFEKQWMNWKFAFDKKYDITDGVVATAICDGSRASTLREDVDKSAFGAKDYNLETGGSTG